MSELLHEGSTILLSPRFYRFAASSLDYVSREDQATALRASSKNPQSHSAIDARQAELRGLLRAARWPQKFQAVGVNFATALDISVGAYRQSQALEQKNTFAALANAHESRRKQAIEAECGLILARSYKEFGRIMEIALVEGCATLELAEPSYVVSEGVLFGMNMQLATK